MEQLDLFSQNISNINNLNIQEKSSLSKQKNETSKRVLNVLSGNFNYRFNYSSYSSYKIEVENGKISKVKFEFGKHKFQVYISYDYEIKKIRNVDYSEANKEDRESIIEVVYVNNFRILLIQKKEKVGYGRIQKNVNYFKFLGIEYNGLASFLKTLVRYYHK